MIKAELRGLLARKLRTVLTMVAIVLGVSMISGTYILTDTIDSSFNQIFKQATANISAVVTGNSVVATAFGNPPIPASLLSVVAKSPGVSLADGEIADTADIFSVGKRGANGQISHRNLGSVGGAQNLLFAVGNQKFNELTLASGSWPRGYQIALDDGTMVRNNLHTGEVIEVATSHHAAHLFTISGTTRFGVSSSIGGATLMEMDLHTAQVMTGKLGKFDQISVIAKPGVKPEQVVGNIRRHIPVALKKRVQVKTGAAERKARESQITDALSILTTVLLAFAGVAIFVGAFIIFNTFSITVAQRAREFALLRTLGATRGQVLRSVLMEAILIGLAASAVGLVAGLGVATGLNQLFKSFGADLPTNSLIFEGRTVIVSLVVGTIVTAVASVVPAFRATRVPPVAALGQGSVPASGRRQKFMPVVGGAIVILGLFLTALGIFGSVGTTGETLLVIGGGAGLLFLGVAMLSPQFVRPLASVVGWPLERTTAVTGRLGRDNVMRNPSRTAITAAALMVGLALVGFVTIFAAELQKTENDAVDREVAGTYLILNSGREGNTIPSSLATRLSLVPGVSLVTGIAAGAAHISGIGHTTVDAVDPRPFTEVYKFQWKHGSDRTAATLDPHGALVSDDFASSNHLKVGSTLRMLTPANIHDTFKIRGIFKSSQLLDSVLIPLATFRSDWQESNVFVLAVNKAAGGSVNRIERRLTNALSGSYPFLTVNSQAQYKAEIDSHINGLLLFVYVLLALSIVVSLFGIINTLVLSIYERTREIGMLRAIGTTRTQIRWMIRWESVITALIGALLGLVLGIALAVLITVGLQSQGIEFDLPVDRLLAFLVFAFIFGIIAAAFPARRAARLDVLQALSYE